MRRFQTILDGLGLGDQAAAVAVDDDEASDDAGPFADLLAGNVGATVEAVTAHLADNPDDREAIAEAEAAGKNRAGVLKALSAPSE